MTKGTDARNHGFFMVDNEVIDNYELGPYAGWLYVAIVRHINHQTGDAFPSIATLAKKTGMSSPTVIKYLDKLEEKNLIRVERQWDESTGANKPNHYFLVGVVKEFNKGGKGALQPLVKEVNTNKTNLNKTNEQDESQEIPPKAKTDHQLMFEAVCNALGMKPEFVTKKRATTIGSTASQIRAAHGTPDQIPGFVKWLKKQASDRGWDDFSEHAMAKYWPEYATSIQPPEVIDFGGEGGMLGQFARARAAYDQPRIQAEIERVLKEEGHDGSSA